MKDRLIIQRDERGRPTGRILIPGSSQDLSPEFMKRARFVPGTGQVIIVGEHHGEFPDMPLAEAIRRGLYPPKH